MPRRSRVDQHALDTLVHKRAGVVRTSELFRLGLPAATLSYRWRPGGPWQRVLPGIVITFSGPVTRPQRLTAALLYAGGGAILTGVTALREWGFRDVPADDAVHLLVPHRRHRVSAGFALVERTRRLPAHRWRAGHPCAPPARAVIDACRRICKLDQVRAIVAEAVQRQFCGLAELLRECADAQIRGTKLPRFVLQEIADGVRSVAEAKARSLLGRSGLPAARWNHDVFDEQGRWLGRPDAAWPDLGVVLEIDSLAWHLSPASYRRTQARQRRMTKHGLLVIAATPSDLAERPAAVLADIRQTLEVAKTRPTPRITVRAPRSAA